MCETVQSSADALLTIINDILDFSKIEAEKLELEPIDFDLRATIEDMITVPATQAQEKGLGVRLSYRPRGARAAHGRPRAACVRSYSI